MVMQVAARLISVSATVVVFVVGLWLAGGVVTDDFALAMWLTGGWFALAGAVALAIAARSRSFRRPVLGAYAVTAALIGGYLAWTTHMDRVVNERVAAPAGNVLLATGRFEPVRHSASGVARALELGRGERVLTLSDFAVANGPDLRVYLVAGPARAEDDVDDVVDLGGLKGNRGNQQYEIAADVDLGRQSTVVIWCRAFSALFARAPLKL